MTSKKPLWHHLKTTLVIILACCLIGILNPTPAEARGETLTVDEILLMAKVMELETGCNSDLCLLYTGSVILNRRNSAEWPDTVQGVIYQKGQYAAWTLHHIDTVKISPRVMSLALKLATCGPLDEEIIFQSMHPELGRVKYHIDTEYFATAK